MADFEIPPEELKAQIDLIAEFVVKKGRHIEAGILKKEEGNDVFDFLRDRGHKYHPYYEIKLEEVAKATGMHVQRTIQPKEEPEIKTKSKKDNPKPKKTQEDLRKEMFRKKTIKPPPADQF